MIEDDLVLVDFQKSSTFLDNNISKHDKILIISGWGWNTPMIGWNRKAYRVANDFKEKIPFELKNDYDIIVTHNASFEQIDANILADFYLKVEYLKSNGKVALWVLKNE